MINEIIAFINNYIEEEFLGNTMRYDNNYSDEECKFQTAKIKKYFHSVVTTPSIGRVPGELNDDFMKPFLKTNFENVKKRDLFIVRTYKNPICGDAVRRILKSDIVYACITSRDEKINKPNGYSRLYFVSETNQGLKIIYLMRCVNSQWEQQHMHNPSKIIEAGELLASEKIVAPEEEKSLLDYSSEEFISIK